MEDYIKRDDKIKSLEDKVEKASRFVDAVVVRHLDRIGDLETRVRYLENCQDRDREGPRSRDRAAERVCESFEDLLNASQEKA